MYRLGTFAACMRDTKSSVLSRKEIEKGYLRSWTSIERYTATLELPAQYSRSSLMAPCVPPLWCQFLESSYPPLHPDLRKLREEHFDPGFYAAFRGTRDEKLKHMKKEYNGVFSLR